MKRIFLGATALIAITLAACTETPTIVDTPPATTMTYKQGARYQYESYNTDATTQQPNDTSRRRRTWTLVNTSASVNARANVAVYIDSMFTLGGLFSTADSVLLQQESGTNDVFRYGSLLGELDIATQVPGLGGLDLGRTWKREARLGSTSGVWLTGEISDGIPSPFPSVPVITSIKVSLKDSAVASSTEDMTIDGQTYSTTKSTHRLQLAALAVATVFGIPAEVPVGSTTILRTIWIAPALGAIVREEREGKVLQISYEGIGAPPVPIPGYVSIMTKVIATGQ